MGKKHKKSQKAQKAQVESKDEINIDFSKIKEKSKELVTRTEQLSKNKYVKYGWITLLIITIIILSTYARMGPLNLPITDKWAEDMFENNYKSAIEQQVREQNPALPDSSVKRLIEEEYNKFYEENKDMIKQQKNELSQEYKSLLQNDNGMTYLLGIDEYLFYSYAKWYDKTGFFGTEVVDEEERFMLRDGRFGMPANFRLHPFMISKLHDLWKPFNPDFNIEWASFYIQVVLLGLASIPLFFLARRFSGTTGGFIAAALVITAVPLVSRTMAGSSDDDAHTVIYTFIMVALLFTALGKNIRTTAIMAGLAGLTMGLFKFAWSGWWYGYLLVLGSAGLYIIYEYVRKRLEGKTLTKNEWINNSTFFVVFLVSSIIFAMMIAPIFNASPTSTAMDLITSPAKPAELVLRLGAGADIGSGTDYVLWPNVLRTVAELNPAKFNQIISGPGGLPLGGGASILFFWLAVAGIISLFLRYKEDTKFVFFGLILLIWTSGMIFVAHSAVRFILMASIPILLGVGALIGAITGPLARYVSKEMNIKKSVFVVIISVLLIMWFLPGHVGSARNVSEGNIPIFDEAWYESMDAIREHAGEERGIISSWWDYGHFFQAYANQTVTFDGGHQGKRIYWMGKTLLTDDPEEALDILKVMNCGQEKPYDLLEEYTNDTFKATNMKLEITRMNKEEARAYLQKELSEEQTQEILGLTHCDDLMPMYFVTSEDMVGKASVWAHFGGWNFTKAYFYYYLKNLPLTEVYEKTEELGMTEEETRKLYNEATTIRNEDQAAQWISPFISYGTRQKTNCQEQNNTIICDYNMVLQEDAQTRAVLRRAIVPKNNLEDTQIIIQVVNRATGTPMGQDVMKPLNIVFEDQGEFRTESFETKGLGLDLVIMNDGNRYSSLLTAPELSKSVFTRLFFMEGRGEDLSMFEKISDTTSFRGERIIVWEVKP